MSLQRARRMLRIAIGDERTRGVFAQARRRQPALAPCSTASVALSRLADASVCLLDKESLIRAFIAELQLDPHPLWSSLAMLACYPMLSHLRSRVRGDAVSTTELDQLVMAIFLEVIVAFPLDSVHDRIFLRLRQKCQRRLFRLIRAEQRHQDMIFVVEAWQLRMYEEGCLDQDRLCYWPDTRDEVEPGPADADDTSEQIDFLIEQAGDVLEGERLDLVIATMVHGERLRQYVERQHAALDPDEHERAYQRIKRRHSRAVATLREHLAHLRSELPAEHGAQGGSR